MKLKAILSSNGEIMSYALIGDIENGVELTLPDDIDLNVLSHAKWDGEKLVELPFSEPAISPTLEERTNALEEAMITLIMRGVNNV